MKNLHCISNVIIIIKAGRKGTSAKKMTEKKYNKY